MSVCVMFGICRHGCCAIAVQVWCICKTTSLRAKTRRDGFCGKNSGDKYSMNKHSLYQFFDNLGNKTIYMRAGNALRGQ